MTTTKPLALPRAHSLSRSVGSVCTLLSNHCRGLVDLLEALPNSGPAVDALHDLIEACDGPTPTCERVTRNLDRIVRFLAGTLTSHIAAAADNGAVEKDIGNAINWYGAALSDLHREVSGGRAAALR